MGIEHTVCSNIMAHLDEYQLVSDIDRQHAYRKRHSYCCETQLATDINDWVKVLDKGGQAARLTHIFWTWRRLLTPPGWGGGPHKLLKSKLFGYGIGGKTLMWVDSFFCYRTLWAFNKTGYEYTLEGTALENVDSIKYPGVTITHDLRWNIHISNMCTKANRTLGFLR